MPDTAATTTQAWQEKRRLFFERMTRLSVELRRASQDMELAVINTAKRKWRRDNPDYSREFPEPIIEDTHLAELKEIFETFSSKLSDAIGQLQIFD